MTYCGIFGAGGFGREVMAWASKIGDMAFVTKEGGDPVNGQRHFTEAEFERFDNPLFAVAIANSRHREKIFENAARFAGPFSLIAPSANAGSHNEIGEGAILCPFSMVTVNVKIGRGFHANIYSYVAHDCVIGDFVTLAPCVKINGNVHIGDHAYIGTGAMIRDGKPEKPLTIGKDAVIGMGAVVLTDVPAGVTVVGNPARVLTNMFRPSQKSQLRRLR